MAWPMPELPPVTIAFFPTRPRMDLYLLDVSVNG